MDWVPLLGAFGIGGLLGNSVTQFLTGKREKAARQVAFRKQQLEQFTARCLQLIRRLEREASCASNFNRQQAAGTLRT